MRIITVFIMCYSMCVTAGEWTDALEMAINTDNPRIREDALEVIRKVDPPWNDVVRMLQFRTFETGLPTDTLLLQYTTCIDSVERPFVLYVPDGYEPSRSHPLLVCLHGGVSRAEIIDDPVDYAANNEFLALAKSAGWFALFPFGQQGATWWDDVGMENVGSLIRRVKRRYDIDDDRVWMAGFSDGASACFGFAMLDPNDFGGFIALNGHIGVASLDGDLPTYAPNLTNTPLYAVTTENDALYPTDIMRRTLEMALDAGGDILYRTLRGDHSFSYAAEELPRIRCFLERHPRDPLPTEIVWECADPGFGQCRWFILDEISPGTPQPWHVDWNTALKDDRVTIGFFPDDSFEGNGIKVGGLVDGSTLASDAGLLRGDIIVAGGSMKIGTMDDLVAFKGILSRGERTTMTVLRGGKSITLTGDIPEATYYNVFKRDRPSGIARIRAAGNKVEVESSRIRSFRILVHPDMFNVNEPIEVWVDGSLVFDEIVTPDALYCIDDFIERFDRMNMFVNEISITLPDGMD